MAVKRILTTARNEKLLRTKSEPVKKINKEIKELFQDIRDTIDANPAVGLAAPQIGVLKRVFGVRLGYDPDAEGEPEMQPPIMMINPIVVQPPLEVERGYDACLSIPNMMGYTDRYTQIRVRYMDEQGTTQERDFRGFDARAIQHEIDHLDGILFTDRLASLDDLFVYVPDEKGRRQAVPYPEVVRRAAAAASDTASAAIPSLPKTNKLG